VAAVEVDLLSLQVKQPADERSLVISLSTISIDWTNIGVFLQLLYGIYWKARDEAAKDESEYLGTCMKYSVRHLDFGSRHPPGENMSDPGSSRRGKAKKEILHTNMHKNYQTKTLFYLFNAFSCIWLNSPGKHTSTMALKTNLDLVNECDK
jgi:hypothetical protein